MRLLRLLCSAGAAAASMAACGGSGRPAASSSTSLPTTAAPATTVVWSSCDGSDGPRGYQCATVAVPRDPLKPGSGTIGMAVDRRRASGTKIGSLLVNPGGPGVSGVDALPGLVQLMPGDLLSHFDVVGFDPPGVGRTAPIICLGPPQLAAYFGEDPAPPTAAGLDQLIASSRQFAAGCEARSGGELPYVSTVDAAMDMDVLRRDLGDSRLTYLGFSYGTLLGATYAGLFPTRVRAMVLDGTLDPDATSLQVAAEQAAGLESDLHTFFSYCESDPSCAWKPGPDPEGQLEELMARSRVSPLPARGTTRTVGPAQVFYGIVAPLYFTSTWPDLAATLADASTGDGTDLLAEFDGYTDRQPNGTYGNLFEANAAVDCLDRPSGTLGEIQAEAPVFQRDYPFFGLGALYGEIQCAVWPIPPTGRVEPIRAAGSPPILVVGATQDPVTPYVWAKSLSSELANAVLLTRIGSGHTSYAASSCVRTAVDRYLITLVPPARGTVCRSN